MLTWPATEQPWVAIGVACYGLSAALAVTAARLGKPWHRRVLGVLLVGMLAFGVAIGQRWADTGQGPFLTLYEVLLSNLFSLGLIYALAYWRVAAVRSSAIIVLPLLLSLGVWLLGLPTRTVPLPPTFDNYWLWLHVLSGKLFLGACLVGVGLSGLLLLRRALPHSTWLRQPAQPELLDATVWRVMAVAFVFHSFMLLAGAVWAHDAWGRYWAWDPLETWAFMTWLALAIVLHVRVTFRLPLWSGWSMVIGVFVLAFLTFFGVPFVSLAPHKGVM
jgi:ABC-type transport system involved in cytochrome c biogenesis permease subunit